MITVITGMVSFSVYTLLIVGFMFHYYGKIFPKVILILCSAAILLLGFFAIYIPFSKGYSYAFDIIVYVTFGYFSRGKLGDR
jgi:hypothetical protein